MTSAVEAFAKTWDETFDAGDLSKLKGLYAGSARVIPSGGTPVEGRDSIGAFFAEVRANGLTTHKIEVRDVVTRGDTVIASGAWSLSGASKDGDAQNFGGNWVNILGREGDSWKILLHTWN